MIGILGEAGSIGSGGVIRPTRGIIGGGGILSAADQIIENYNLTTALPSGATFTRSSSGTRINSAGTLVTETTDVARFDYSPTTLAPQGLLLEPARTNLVIQSDALATTPWSASGCTVTANAIVAPDGATTAETLALTATTGGTQFAIIFQQFTGLTPGATYTASVWIKSAAGGQTVWLMETPTGSVYTRTSIAVTTAWVRHTLTFVAAGTSTYIQIGVDKRDTSQTGQAAATIHAWRVQLELGSTASSSIATTTATVTRAADSLSLPIPDGIWDITTTDTNGSTTVRRSVVGGYSVTPRSGQLRVTSIRAALVATYAGFDSDAVTYLHNNQLTDLTGRRAIDATIKAIKANGSLTWADIAFAGFAPGRNLDTGTTVKLAGGWTAATAVNGTLSSESRMRNGNAYGLFTNNGSTTTNPTNISFPSLPLSADYGMILLCRTYGNPAGSRPLYGIGNNTVNMVQLGAQHVALGGDNDTNFTRALAPSRTSAIGHIQEANAGSPRGIALAEYGYDRTVTGVNAFGTLTAYLGTQWISSSASNTTVGGDPEVILEGVCFLKNPSKAKWRTLASILKANLVVPEPRQIKEFILTGQSNAPRDAAIAFDLIVGADADYKGRYLIQNYTNINQPLSQWVGSSAPYARTGYYNSDILPGTGSWAVLTNTYEPNGTPAGMIWVQGEADAGFSQAGNDTTLNAIAADYQNKLQAFVNFVRADYPNLPIVLLQIDWTTATGAQVTRLATIRAAQAAIVAANTKMTLVDTRGMTRNADGVHLQGQGIVDAMTAAWTALKALL